MKEISRIKAKKVASNIRKIREFRNYTQEYLAAKLEISQNAYSKIELGYCQITLSRLFHIAMLLEVEMMDVINTETGDLVQLRSVAAS
ncbi:helix-turn-helix domain-containing protein [Hufsiella ginkgonis]|uniref:Helix-turn-helix domain-containing protein n=1 Tax=Hufsiella ginkgonis TaxID=2695274 RepID=A0A7K1XUJ2_9SPHI|nr:helix-turn-helix transcriptional regulator [Hufsiella ginkgonis]MXV14652.1 helix-turn-helix domain-containing protein [Hufsiella ginkgonis]